MWVSFLEIYNESAYDLLEHVSKKTAARIPLPLKEDRNGMPYVKGTMWPRIHYCTILLYNVLYGM